MADLADEDVVAHQHLLDVAVHGGIRDCYSRAVQPEDCENFKSLPAIVSAWVGKAAPNQGEQLVEVAPEVVNGAQLVLQVPYQGQVLQPVVLRRAAF